MSRYDREDEHFFDLGAVQDVIINRRTSKVDMPILCFSNVSRLLKMEKHREHTVQALATPIKQYS